MAKKAFFVFKANVPPNLQRNFYRDMSQIFSLSK